MSKFYFLGDSTKLSAMVLCSGGFCGVGCCCCFLPHRRFLHFRATFPCHRHFTPASQTPWRASTGSELYPGYFQLLYFCQAFPSQLYRERYCFEWAFFTRKRFLPYAPSPKFLARFCNSDAGRNTPSRIFLCACPHRVVPSGWRMDLNYSYCSYKTIDLSIATKHRVKIKLLNIFCSFKVICKDY